MRLRNKLGVWTADLILAITPSPLEHLRSLRNFLAHRNEGTALEVRSAATTIGAAPVCDVIAILQTVTAGATESVLETWVQQLQTMSEIAGR